jgi:predicted DNA-binding protein (MmcQ/YjbR family)
MMDIEAIREFLLSFEFVTEETPFGPDTLVYKVAGKIFAIMPLNEEKLRMSLKNTPEKNLELRAEYDGIQGAFHMNKVHWNMLLFEFGLKISLVKQLISESYHIVYDSHTKKIKEQFPISKNV